MENQNPSAEALQQEATAVEITPTQQEQPAEQRAYSTTADIIIRVKELAQDPLNAQKEELDMRLLELMEKWEALAEEAEG